MLVFISLHQLLHLYITLYYSVSYFKLTINYKAVLNVFAQHACCLIVIILYTGVICPLLVTVHYLSLLYAAEVH